jgi:uncharacterized protein DUF6492
MKVDIFRISFRDDLTWLYYSTRLLLKYWQEESQIYVRLDEDCRETVQSWDLGPKVTYQYIKPWPDGYTQQMYEKMFADHVSDADLFMLCDSDLMLYEPCSLELLMQDGKPIIEWCEWADSPVAEQVWRRPTSQLMGMDLDRDYMVQSPFLWWRDTFALTRKHIESVTGKSLYEAVYSDVPFRAENFLHHPIKFSEHEALNLFAVKHQPERYYVRRNTERPAHWPWRLYWSHGDWSPGLKVHIESLL